MKMEARVSFSSPVEGTLSSEGSSLQGQRGEYGLWGDHLKQVCSKRGPRLIALTPSGNSLEIQILGIHTCWIRKSGGVPRNLCFNKLWRGFWSLGITRIRTVALNWGQFCFSEAFENYWKCYFIHNSLFFSLSHIYVYIILSFIIPLLPLGISRHSNVNYLSKVLI